MGKMIANNSKPSTKPAENLVNLPARYGPIGSGSSIHCDGFEELRGFEATELGGAYGF